MTINMAIEILKTLRDTSITPEDKEEVRASFALDIALDMAIKALEQEPCEDWHDVPSNEMTLGQARQAVKDLRKMLAKYLWQEPCEDAISREAAIEAVIDLCKYYTPTKSANHPHMDFVIEELQNLPPVTPTRPHGEWINIGSTIGLIDDYRCSICNHKPERKEIKGTWGWSFTNFCPNCGADMRGES